MTKTKLKEAMKRYVEMRVDNIIAHEDVHAYYAPLECHSLVESDYQRLIIEFEKSHLPVDELFLLFKEEKIERAINRLHAKTCPFCR